MNFALNGLLFSNAHRLDLTRAEYWTLHGLANAQNAVSGLCFPSTTEIARVAKLHERTVMTAIQSLERKGFITITQRAGCKRYFTINESKLNPLQLPTPLQEHTPLQELTGVQKDTPLQDSTVHPCKNLQYTPACSYRGKENIKENIKENTTSGGRFSDSPPCSENPPNESDSGVVFFSPSDFVPGSVLPTDSKKRPLKPPRSPASPLTFKFNFETLPDHWRKYCVERRPDLDPDLLFIDIREYFTYGKGADVRRGVKGWNQTWQGCVRRQAEGGTSPAHVNGKSLLNSDCPTQKILDLYHEELPSLPEVVILSDAMRNTVAHFWETIKTLKQYKENGEDGLAVVRAYFRYVSLSDFLMGRGSRGGSPPWSASFSWLVDPSNAANVMNGNYENRL